MYYVSSGSTHVRAKVVVFSVFLVASAMASMKKPHLRWETVNTEYPAVSEKGKTLPK